MRRSESGAIEADTASGRAAFYEFLVSGFGRLPDRALLGRIKKGDFLGFVGRCSELGNKRMDSGVQLLSSYQSSVQGRSEDELLTELSVDRTRVLRGTGHPDLKPPYEGIYRSSKGSGDSVLEIRRFYRKAGLIPEDQNQEAADYLLVELDFMKQLCLREKEQWRRNDEAVGTVSQEGRFLGEHLTQWVGDFCAEVEQHAQTDFYRALSLVLDGYIAMDKEWVIQLAHQMRPGR